MRIEDEHVGELTLEAEGVVTASASERALIHRQKAAREGREAAAERKVAEVLEGPGPTVLTQFEKAALNLLGRILVAVEKGH